MKKIMVFVLACLFLSGCAVPLDHEQAGHGIEFVDVLGRTVTVLSPQSGHF